MTYCVAITVDAGLVFASDSRTNAGPDQVSTYSKMHTFSGSDRQIVLLSAGNLATTQGVVARLRRELDNGGTSLLNVRDMEEVAEHVGDVMREQQAKHGDAVSRAGFSAEASFIVGGQIGQQKPALYLVYPQGNYITTSDQTPYLQIGESKYGKAILDRVIDHGTSLDDAVRCALVSMDSTIRSNATVGPPVEVLAYPTNSLSIDHYALLAEDDDYLTDLRRSWNERIIEAFLGLPSIDWGSRHETSHNSSLEPAAASEPPMQPQTGFAPQPQLEPEPGFPPQPVLNQGPAYSAPPMAAPLPNQTGTGQQTGPGQQNGSVETADQTVGAWTGPEGNH